eukprot:TRINITY_DN12060_c0_g1_i2.p1 TRINITY_DN12060_c0_g1~~TRINITY_DN12060_c0_g1_i2.p1  ORF type:complete len:265 (-),score=66.43 TRINITY_DN12060_c0_g1_i2:12-779(-)
MHGRMYIEKNIPLQKDRNRIFELHQKKLNNIGQYKKESLLPQSDPYIRKIYDSKKRNRVFTEKVKNSDIRVGNEKLLKKLTEIAHGKQVTLHKLGEVEMGKTLNYYFRKRESNKIEYENMALAKRLLEKKSEFDKKVLDKDFIMHRRYMSQITKLSPKKKLPSLQRNETVVSNLPQIETQKDFKSQRKEQPTQEAKPTEEPVQKNPEAPAATQPQNENEDLFADMAEDLVKEDKKQEESSPQEKKAEEGGTQKPS